jgi:arylsulfatase A-like enzyme
MYPTIKADFVEQGIVLDRMYSAATCAPSRRSLLSGRTMSKIGR